MTKAEMKVCPGSKSEPKKRSLEMKVLYSNEAMRMVDCVSSSLPNASLAYNHNRTNLTRRRCDFKNVSLVFSLYDL